MKKNILLLIICLLVLQNTFSQDKDDKSKSSETYVSIKFFKQIFNREVTKKDLKHIKIKGKDTLILIKDKSKIKEYISKNNDKFDNKILGKVQEHRAYIPLSQYKKKYKKVITQKDIDNFLFRNGDTLVMIDDKDFYNKGVSVPYQPKDSSFLETYKDVVYQKYNALLVNQERKDYMRLWRVPIKIYFAKSLDKEYKNAIIKTANMISKEIDSLTISFVDEIEKSNYIIYQVDDLNKYKYSKLLSKNQYIDYGLYWNNNKIYDAKLEVNLTKYNKESKNTNINHLNQIFFKSLGRFYESSKIPYGSILSNKTSSRKSISKLDIDILKYHYSFGICKGTDLKTFEEQHIKAKEIFKKTGIHLRFIHIDD